MFNTIAMITLIIMGFVFIGQGAYYMYHRNSYETPRKINIVGSTSIIVGIVALAFAVMYALI